MQQLVQVKKKHRFRDTGAYLCLLCGKKSADPTELCAPVEQRRQR